MPNLFSHLMVHLDLGYPHVRYSPPDNTPAWKI